jgi:hypothetical protein
MHKGGCRSDPCTAQLLVQHPPSVARRAAQGTGACTCGNCSCNLPICLITCHKHDEHCNPGKCRYCGEHIATSLTLPLRKKPGAQLAIRLCQFLRPKVHPLLLDSTINSPQTVRLNVYQVQRCCLSVLWSACLHLCA